MCYVDVMLERVKGLSKTRTNPVVYEELYLQPVCVGNDVTKYFKLQYVLVNILLYNYAKFINQIMFENKIKLTMYLSQHLDGIE